MNNSHKSLTEEWQSLMCELYPGHQKPLTFEDRRRLRKLGDDIGKHAVEVVSHTLHKWFRFGERARYADGLNAFPAIPTIGFLQLHQKQAVDMYHDSLKPKPEPPPPVTYSTNWDSEQRARRLKRLERTPDGRPKYNDAGEEIYYPTHEEIVKLLDEFSSKGKIVDM